ncbi:thioredoxin family protein [Nocardia sp. NPDC052566]|uniref:thioredoxin family protein n=1 Tax=Nocardia sp. NPDC052566 TaxID=3364330 RepID=UPI0037C681AC
MPTPTSAVRAVDADEFDKALADDSTPLLVDFTASWCPPCHALAPHLDRFADAERDRIRVVSVDVDENPTIAERYSVHAMPTLILIQHGAPVLEWAGPSTLEPLTAILDAVLAAPDTAPKPRAPEPAARTIRLPGAPDVTVDLLAREKSATAETTTVLDLPAGARLILRGQDANLDALTDLAPDAVNTLMIARTPMRANEIDKLLHLTGLGALYLFDTGIDAEGIARLTGLTALRHLEIRNNPQTGEPADPAALTTLRLALPHTTINGTWARPDLIALLPQPGTDDEPAAPEVAPEETPPVTVALRARRHTPDRATAYLTLHIADGYHLNAPGTDNGLPITIDTAPDTGWHIDESTYPATEDAHLTGTTLIAVDLTGAAADLTLNIRLQACRDDTCFTPTTHTAHCAVTPR